MITNRRRPDPLMLRTFAVTMSFVRAWLLLRGHIRASHDLSSITLEDAEDAFDRMREETRSPGMDDRRAKQILGALKGGPAAEASVIPTLADCRALTPIVRGHGL